jgi:hypothetical protein
MFHKVDEYLPSSDEIVEDASKKKVGKGGKGAAGFTGGRPPRKSDPSQVGTLQQQKAPLTTENPQSVGAGKISKGKDKPDPRKSAVEAQNMKKQKSEMSRPAPHAVGKKKK